MGKLKRSTARPWLTSTGVEIPMAELRVLVKSWNATTWGNYLQWFTGSSTERLVAPDTYNRIGEEMTESVFEQLDQQTDPNTKALCDQAMSQLSDKERSVIEQTFFEGRTIREIAASDSLAKSTVHYLKNKAIRGLKRGIQGNVLDTQQFMRGENKTTKVDQPSIWDQELAQPIIDARTFKLDDHVQAFNEVSLSSLRVALLELSPNVQRIIYLRHWCKLSLNETARALRTGVNNVEQIEMASITKLKRNIIAFETGNQFGGAN